MTKVGRNDPCPCGSGKKYKKCCEEKIKHKKFEAQLLSSSAEQPQTTKEASKISSLFFQKTLPSFNKPKSPEESPEKPLM